MPGGHAAGRVCEVDGATCFFSMCRVTRGSQTLRQGDPATVACRPQGHAAIVTGRARACASYAATPSALLSAVALASSYNSCNPQQLRSDGAAGELLRGRRTCCEGNT